MTPPRLLTPRWLAAGGALLLAAVLGVALLLQNSGAACAAPPSASTARGKATFFTLSGPGNCSYPGPPADGLFVALGRSQYSGAAACGTYLDVTGPKGTVRVKVVDACPECAVGHLDLSAKAFARIANPVQGVVPITYRAVPSAPPPGPLSVRVQEGSSKYWFSLLVDNHGTQLRSVTVNGRSANRAEYNYWIIENPAIGNGPYRVKITDVYGHTATLTNVKLAPGRVQKTTVRLASGGTAAAAPGSASGSGSTKVHRATPRPVPSSARPSATHKAKPKSTRPTAATRPVEAGAAPVTTVEPSAETTTEPAVDLAAGKTSCG